MASPDPEKPEIQKKRRASLGRGLDSLLGEYLSEPDPTVPAMQMSMQLDRSADGQTKFGPTEIALSNITPNPDQPRRTILEDDLNELTQSIQVHGVLQAILIRPDPSGKPKHYQIVAGERRWRASKKAGLKMIPAVVRVLDDLAVTEIAIIENVQREGLNPMEEAEAYRQLVDKFGRTQDSLAKHIGKSRSHIANVMRLLKLPEKVQKQVRDRQLSSGHARTILAAEDPERLAAQIIKDKLSVRDAETIVRAEGQARKAESQSKDTVSASMDSASSDDAAQASVFDIKRKEAGQKEAESSSGSGSENSAELQALERSLHKVTGLECGIRRQGSGGEVWINYNSMQDLDAICRLLSNAVGQQQRSAG